MNWFPFYLIERMKNFNKSKKEVDEITHHDYSSDVQDIVLHYIENHPKCFGSEISKALGISSQKLTPTLVKLQRTKRVSKVEDGSYIIY